MAACSSKLSWLSWTSESTWGESSTSTSSQVVIPHNGRVDMSSIKQAMITSARAVQYKNEVATNIPGPFADASFTFQMYLVGHGSTTAGATTATDFETAIAYIMGGGNVSAASGTTIAGVSTVSSLNTTASGTFDIGSLFRVGVLNDARGGGQWGVVDSHTGTTLVSETAFGGAPTAALPDVVYSAYTAYTQETTCATTSKRAFIKSADLQLCLHGCFVKSYTISGYNPGELPMIEVTMGVSWAEPISATFPDATAMSWTTQPVPVGAGGIFLNTYGTVTRSIVNCRNLSINVTAGVVPLLGHATVNGYQTITGASRTPDAINVSVTLDAEGPSATPTWWTNWLTNARWHMLAGLSTGIGSAVAGYFPNLAITGDRPTQVDADGLNRVTINFQAGADTAESTDELSLSAMRWGFA